MGPSFPPAVSARIILHPGQIEPLCSVLLLSLCLISLPGTPPPPLCLTGASSPLPPRLPQDAFPDNSPTHGGLSRPVTPAVSCPLSEKFPIAGWKERRKRFRQVTVVQRGPLVSLELSGIPAHPTPHPNPVPAHGTANLE